MHSSWLRELMDDPDLEAAEDLLEAAVPTGFTISIAPSPQAVLGTPKRNLWRLVSNAIFYTALAAIALGAIIYKSDIKYVLILLYAIILISIALRVFLGERKAGYRKGECRTRYGTNEF